MFICSGTKRAKVEPLSPFVSLIFEVRNDPVLNSHHELSQNQAITISDHFAKQIATNTSARGEVFIAKKFRAVFILLNEVYVVTVCHKSDYPYDALRCANNAKLLMFEACKGVEVTVINLYKKFGQIMLALEELINETNTFKPPSTSMEMVGKTKLGEAHNISAQYNSSMSMGTNSSKLLVSQGSTLGITQDPSKTKTRRGTIRQMEKMISHNADEMWRETQKQMEVHFKRFQTLDKFQFRTDQVQEANSEQVADSIQLPDSSDIVSFQFGLDFTAPDEEDALPSFNHKRAKSTNTGSESNGISSFRKRQMEHIALGQQMFPLSDEEWHSLQTPALPENLKPIVVPVQNKPPPFNPSIILQPQVVPPVMKTGTLAPNKVGTAFDRGDSKLISFEPFDLHTTSSKLEGEDTEVDMSDEDYTFRSDKLNTSTNEGIYDYNPPKFIHANSTSNLPTTAPFPGQPNQPLNTSVSSSFLDDIFGPTTGTTQQKPPANPSSLLIDLDNGLAPQPNKQPPFNGTNANGSFVPPVPVVPTPSVSTNIPPIRPTNVDKTQPKEINMMEEMQNKQLNPVQKTVVPVFDPDELKKSIEQSQQKRAAVLPFKILVSETVVKNMSGLTEDEYNFMGQIELILFNKESYREGDAYNFVLSLINDQHNNSENITKVSKIVCNPKIAKDVTEGENVNRHNFECNVTSQDINPKTQSTVLLKYKLKEHLNLVPIKLRPLYHLATKDGQTMLTLSIDYIVNPTTPVEKLSFLIRVAPSLEQITLKSQSKPEGRWNGGRQELLISVENAEPKGSVMAKFLLNRAINDISELQTEFLCKFNAKGLLAGFTVEGGESKRSVHNQVFLGGSEYSITTPSWRYKLTSENLNPQFANK